MHYDEWLYGRLLPLLPFTYENLGSHKLSPYQRYKGADVKRWLNLWDTNGAGAPDIGPPFRPLSMCPGAQTRGASV